MAAASSLLAGSTADMLLRSDGIARSGATRIRSDKIARHDAFLSKSDMICLRERERDLLMRI